MSSGVEQSRSRPRPAVVRGPRGPGELPVAVRQALGVVGVLVLRVRVLRQLQAARNRLRGAEATLHRSRGGEGAGAAPGGGTPPPANAAATEAGGGGGPFGPQVAPIPAKTFDLTN